MKSLSIRTKLDQENYPVAQAAALLGITDGRIYQLIAGEGAQVPEGGQYLRTATNEEGRDWPGMMASHWWRKFVRGSRNAMSLLYVPGA